VIGAYSSVVIGWDKNSSTLIITASVHEELKLITTQ